MRKCVGGYGKTIADMQRKLKTDYWLMDFLLDGAAESIPLEWQNALFREIMALEDKLAISGDGSTRPASDTRTGAGSVSAGKSVEYSPETRKDKNHET